MTQVLFLALMVVGGLFIALQAPINAALARAVGPVQAAFVSFSVGALALLTVVLASGTGQVAVLRTLPKWQFTGGLLGAGFVALIVAAVPRIGAASAIFAAILGQVACSLAIDHYGLFGAPVLKVNALRLVGVTLMALGVVLVFRGR